MDADAFRVRPGTRIANILSRPRIEWPIIAAEPRDIPALYRGYIAPLAAIPALCRLAGLSLVGVGTAWAGYFPVAFTAAVAIAIVQYVFALVGVYVAAVVVAKLAPSFQSTPDVAQALKLVSYSMTPVWLAGVLYLVPPLAPLVLLAALYSIYLCYLGVAPVMSTPGDKVIAYLLVSAIVLIVVYLVIALLMAALMPLTLVAPRPGVGV